MESYLGYNLDSELMLRIGVNLMLAVVSLTIAVFLLVIFLRILLLYHNYRREQFIALWRPTLTECIIEIPEKLPTLDHKYIHDFIGEWNSLYENLGGISHENLINVAIKLKIHTAAMVMLISNHPKIRLTGIITLGNMRAKQAWPMLESISKSEQVFLSIAAYRALVLIDREKALDNLLPQLIKRTDWPASMVAKILKNIDNLKVCELLAQSCENATEHQLENLIQYINTLKCTCTTEVFRKILAKDKDDHIKSLCLKELNDPLAIDLVYKHIASRRWHVRMHAAAALGNIGSKKDAYILINLLDDNHWWVRYRAAQSLIRIPSMSIDDLLEIKKKHEKNEAKSIIDQVIAEKDFS